MNDDAPVELLRLIMLGLAVCGAIGGILGGLVGLLFGRRGVAGRWVPITALLGGGVWLVWVLAFVSPDPDGTDPRPLLAGWVTIANVGVYAIVCALARSAGRQRG